mgnify:CR=1 FL=1
MTTDLLIMTLNEIDGVKKIMPQIKKEWVDNILVVDGGSTDGTIEEAKKLGIEVIHQTNRGEGNACRIGVENTTSDFIIFFSPDGNDEPEEIPKMIEKISNDFDIVHISRFGQNSDSEDAGLIDRFGNRMFTFLANCFFGGKLTDTLFGFKIIKKKVSGEKNDYNGT